tara:strand:- start:48 stop:218 length:171 start_codon:yes stop_codon:yes gene_type:complete
MKKKISISLTREEIINLLLSLEINLDNECQVDDTDETRVNQLALLKNRLEKKLEQV